MAAEPDFTDVMTGLTSLRLAVWDELAERGPAGTEQLAAWLHPRGTVAQVLTALGWLHSNRLVRLCEHTQRWDVVPVRLAQQVFNEDGPLSNPMMPRPASSMLGGEPTLVVPPPPHVRVHTHQAQFQLIA
jgi:hypothetical protein